MNERPTPKYQRLVAELREEFDDLVAVLWREESVQLHAYLTVPVDDPNLAKSAVHQGLR
jgi:hypothetical protein